MEILEIKYKFVQYDYFALCKDTYPYLEDTDNISVVCKEEIKKWIKLFFMQTKKLGLTNIYNLTDGKNIIIEEFIENENFLFYSYLKGIEEMIYVLTSDSIYKSKEDWCSRTNNDLIICNDNDGVGICIAGKKEILDKLDKLNIAIFSDIEAKSFLCWQD